MVLRRFLGLRDEQEPAPSQRPADAAAPTDTATVRRIVAAIEALPEAQRRFVAGFAYVLGRTAHADLLVSDDEIALMERTVMDVGGLPEPQAVLVVQIARSQNELYGGTEDYLVTREFRQISSEDQRLSLLRCAFAVGAAEGSITAEESAELNQIAKELDLSDEQLTAVRGEFTEQFAAIQQMRETTGLKPKPDA
ncbi:MAG: TerB family tellurite resistance protein [Chloroflexi bacterium]|jgi:uncharacterized tellurite resistance protein B-like protein|nr:TerB family tellurite resistance protein [Chloroflexota bacterium]MBA3959802.1 TerB family tellurite resistance protein [Chloroflexota bacterium]